MLNLDSRRKNFQFVLNIPSSYTQDVFETQLHKCCNLLEIGGCFYAWVKHDYDVNEDGSLKTIHYHLIVILPVVKRAKTMILKLSDYLSEDKLLFPTNCISIDDITDLNCAMQYLIHKNDLNKYQYNECDIHTNLDSSTFRQYMDKDTHTIITTGLIFDLVDKGYTNTEMAFILGINNYHLHKGTIEDFRHDKITHKQLWDRLREYNHGKTNKQ